MVMIAPDQLHDVLVQTNHAVISAVSTQFLADASSSAASAAGDGSWWDSFINLFKTALTLVHSVIEGPLRAVGVDQSWGISIAVFTAREYRTVEIVYPKRIARTAPHRSARSHILPCLS
jgi:hypothetical protein